MTKLRGWLGREWALYAAATLACLVLLVKVFGLGHKSLTVPLYADESSDTVYYFMQLKVLLDTGWVFHHPDLGAPYPTYFHDFPHFDALHLVLCKGIGWVWPNWAAVANLFFLLTFVLTTWTALYLFRYLRVPGPVAVALALLYAFQYYHLARGQSHLMLSAYYHVPLFVLVVVWLLEPRGLGAEGGGRWLVAVPRFWVAAAICALGALGGHYYACFAIAFFLMAGLYQAVRARSGRPLAHAGLLTAVVFGVFAANLLPNYLYWSQAGPNRGASAKSPAGPETYGLKITQMVLPVPEHRLPALAEMTREYNATSPTVNENNMSHLGATASVGYLLLLVLVLLPSLAPKEGIGLHPLAALALTGTLIATTGGLMSLFGYLVTPQLHGVNRMSIYLALFGLLAVGWCLAAWLRRIERPAVRAGAAIAVGAMLLIGGLYDQVSPAVRKHLSPDDELHARDAAFGAALQAALPEGSRVFFMPVGSFPTPSHRTGKQGSVIPIYYEHLRTFLHTRGLKLSQPAITNRAGGSWAHKVGQLPPEEMLEALALAGFSGLVVDARAKQEEEIQLVRWLEDHVGPATAIDGASRYFFDLRADAARRRQSVPAAEWERRASALVPPVEVTFGASFHGEEKGSDQPEFRRWRWSIRREGELRLYNMSDRPVRVRLSFTLYSAHGERATFHLSSALLADGEGACTHGERCERLLTVPPGSHTLTICGATKSLKTPEGRKVWFRVESLELDTVRPE